MGRTGTKVAGSLWLAWLLAAQGVIWTVHSAAGPCATGCVGKVEPVCGNDGRSYANSCVATCAEVFVKHQGYCDGEKIMFISPAKHSSRVAASTAGQPKPNWRVAHESAQVIHTSTINRFIHQGYVYRGRVALSSMPSYLKESSAGSAVAADETTTESQQESSSSSGGGGGSSSGSSSSSSGGSSVRVAIIRVDNKGHMYGKTFSYDPKRFPTTAYPPFDPDGSAAAAAAPPTAAAAAVVTNPSSSTSVKSSPPSTSTAAPAAITPPATSGPPIISRTTAQPTPSPAAAAVPAQASATGSTSSSSSGSTGGSSSSSGGKSPQAAPPAEKPAAPTPAVQHPHPASKPSESLPPASQIKAPAPGPAAQPPAKTPGHSSSGGSSSSAILPAKQQHPLKQQQQQQQQLVETDTVAGAGSDVGSSAGFSNTPGTSTPAAVDLSSLVHLDGSSSGSGEILKPELGSYANSPHAGQQEAGATTTRPAGDDLAGGNNSSTRGPTPGVNSSSSTAASGALLAGMAASQPIVTVQGDESAPGGTVTTVTFANGDDTGGHANNSSEPSKPAGDKPGEKPEAACSPEQQVCADKVTGTSMYYGTKPPASKYMDQVPMIGKGRISGMVLYYNKTSGCLRGTQVMYNYVDHPTSYYTSVLLGSAITKPSNIAVKTLMLAQDESIVKAEVYAPKCVRYVKLFTNHNNTVLVGTHGNNATLATPQRYKSGVSLLAIRGFQDRAISHAATMTNPAYTSPGVLKQLQFVWGARVCDCSSTAAAAAAAKPSPSAASSIALETAPAGTTSSSGRRLAQILQRAAASTSVVLDAEELEQLQQQRRHEWQRQRQLHKLWRRQQLSGAPALAADGLVGDLSAAGDGWSQQSRVQQLYSPRPVSFGSMLARATLGMDGNLPAYDGPNIHRMLSVITPDSREPCPVLTYPFKTLGQINAKAEDGGFVCSGGLIAPDRVLTAGHCVWDDRDSQGPFEDLAFAPAQWKKDGKITAPLGKVDWDYVTLFEAYVNDPDGDGLAYDVAVITLSKPVGQQLGYLGIRADPPPCAPEAMSLTLAGYPGDDPDYPIPGGWQGGCFFDICQVNFSCSVSITNHTCDSYVGQSGAPMYDKQNYVRAVHTLGVLPGFSTSNGAITIQKFILDNVMGYWKETNGFSPLAPGSVGTGSYY